MNINVKLFKNRNKPKDDNFIFGEHGLVSRSVVIDSYQVPRAAEAWPDAVKKTYNLLLGYVKFRLIERIKVQCFKFPNKSHSLKFLPFGTSI